jgi:hypothetical protein
LTSLSGAELTAALSAAKMEATPQQVTKMIRSLEDGNGYINYRNIAKELLGSPNVNRPLDATDSAYHTTSERNRSMRPYGTDPEPRPAMSQADNASSTTTRAASGTGGIGNNVGVVGRPPSGKRMLSRELLVSSIRLEHVDMEACAAPVASAAGGGDAALTTLSPGRPESAVAVAASGCTTKPPRSPFAMS